MAKQTRSELVPINPGFDYSPLEPRVAKQARTTAERIRQTVKKNLEDIIEIGRDLLAVKAALPHGSFGAWLHGEFGWAERTARNFMAVAERFGAKTAIISDLQIHPTAAYLLAAPSAPDQAWQRAVERAESGEKITTEVAKTILAKARTKDTRKARQVSQEKLGLKLAGVLERYRDRWDPKELTELASVLRQFADSLEDGNPRGAKKTK